MNLSYSPAIAAGTLPKTTVVQLHQEVLTAKYPISQFFHSIQGEGARVGAPMTFCRTAGCNVGVYENPNRMDEGELKILRTTNPTHSICTSAMGRQFLCDTDYHRIDIRGVNEILNEVTEDRICITGGEPLMYNLDPLVFEAARRGFEVQIETSGTLPITEVVGKLAWITCSPKRGYLESNAAFIHEYKFVLEDADCIEAEATLAKIRAIVEGRPLHMTSPLVYLQPVNLVDKVDLVVLGGVMTLLRRAPQYRLSVQLHKILGVE